MSLTVVTSFSPAGHAQYGGKFLRSFKGRWPQEVALKVYHEGPCPKDVGSGEGVDLLSTEPCASFLDRHRDNPVVHGRKPAPGHAWKDSAIKARQNFRYDAYKFARKVFAVAHAARGCGGKLFWLDADIQTHAVVPAAFLHEMLPDEAGICHIARPGYHSECGFIGYNLAHAETRRFLTDFEHVYAADLFLQYREWHDSYIFDRLLERSGVNTRQIPWTQKMTPVEHSPLGKYLIHFKGTRKDSQDMMDRHWRVLG